jgi:hypothetical protein
VVNALALANVRWQHLTVADVVADCHTSATSAAHRNSLEQGRPLAWWTVSPIGTVGLTVIVQTAQVLFVLCPGDVVRVRVANQRVPLLTG